MFFFQTMRVRKSIAIQAMVAPLVFLLVSLMTTTDAWSFAKGWSEQKRPQNIGPKPGETITIPPVLWPDIAASGDNVFIVYTARVDATGGQGENLGVGLRISRDRGKTWSEPQNLFLGICSAPAVWAKDNNVMVVWPVETFDGDIRNYNLHYAFSQDAGKTWAIEDSLVAATPGNALSPRLISAGQKILLCWMETPVSEIETDSPAEMTPENIDISTLKLKERSSSKNKELNQISISIYVADFVPGQAKNFSPRRLVSSFFAARPPQTFTPFRDEDGNYIVAYNKNFELEFYRSRNDGSTWQRHDYRADFFDPASITYVASGEDGPEAIRVERKPYLPVALQHMTLKDAEQITPTRHCAFIAKNRL